MKQVLWYLITESSGADTVLSSEPFNVSKGDWFMDTLKNDEIRQAVRKTYAGIAHGENSNASGCSCGCGSTGILSNEQVSGMLGYSHEEVTSVPEGANMGLGCGNPQAIARLRQGETVVDLGSGGGFDCFLAAKAVGETGRVIGVDMTPDMISKSRENGEKSGYSNVEFRLGEIEHLPVADNTADVLISNCVINLSPEKDKVYREAYRVLQHGGRIALSDIVLLKKLPENLQNDIALLVGCVAGAAELHEVESMLVSAGFSEISIRVSRLSRELVDQWMPGKSLEEYIASASIEAVKK